MAETKTFTGVKEEKIVKKVRKGYIQFSKPAFYLQNDSELIISFEEQSGFEAKNFVPVPMQCEYVTLYPISKTLYLARESTDEEIEWKNAYRRCVSEVRVMGATAYITRNNQLRFQERDLLPLMKQKDRAGYFYFHLVTGERNYIEISFSPRRLFTTYSDAVIQKYGSVLAATRRGSLDITYRNDNRSQTGFNFDIPQVFLNLVHKGQYLPFHYEGDKLIIEATRPVCSCCGREISSYEEDAKTNFVCKTCADTLDGISDRLLEYDGITRDRLRKVVKSYTADAKAQRKMEKKLEKKNAELMAALKEVK